MAERRGSTRLLARYLLVGIAIAVVSSLGAIWLSATTTFSYDQSRSDRNSTSAQAITDALLDWAGEHTSWAGVDPLLDRLQTRYGLAITLVDAAGRTLADTDPTLPDTRKDSITIDALAVDPGLAAGLDPRITGAFALDDAERRIVEQRAISAVDCLGRDRATTSTWRTGRVIVTSIPGAPDCGREELNRPQPTEAAALARLTELTDRCLLSAGLPAVGALQLDDGGDDPPSELAFRAEPPPAEADRDAVAACLVTARVEQAAPITAPPVTLYVRDPELVGDPFRDLSPGSKARIALVVGVVLLMVLAGATVIVFPTLRGARALTAAVDRFAAGDRRQRIEVSGSAELRRLAEAFTEMSRQIADNEDERRRMLGDVAHELRSPLTNIRGWLEASRDDVGVTDEEAREVIAAETLRLQRITADLLLLAQAESGSLSLDVEEVDAAEVAEEVVRARTAAATASGIALTVRSEGDTVVRSDALRIGQVLDNLVANALRHTPTGGRVAATVVGGGREVTLRVADTGVGIAADDLARVFDRFWRGDRARTRQGESTGLGLSIVREIVRALGGTVTVESVAGEGATFTVVLPRAHPIGADAAVSR